jgi:single-stranded DNA-binding protein
LARGAQLQLRGRLAMRSFERRIVPRSGLEILAPRWLFLAGKRWGKHGENMGKMMKTGDQMINS